MAEAKNPTIELITKKIATIVSSQLKRALITIDRYRRGRSRSMNFSCSHSCCRLYVHSRRRRLCRNLRRLCLRRRRLRIRTRRRHPPLPFAEHPR